MQNIIQSISYPRAILTSILRTQDDSVVCASRESMGPVTALGFAAYRGATRIVQSLWGSMTSTPFLATTGLPLCLPL